MNLGNYLSNRNIEKRQGEKASALLQNKEKQSAKDLAGQVSPFLFSTTL